MPRDSYYPTFGELKQAESDDKDQLIKDFLQNMSAIESSNGKNLDHRMIASGIHEGQKAIGQYGLMPNTVDEINRRMERQGQGNDMTHYVQSLEPAQMKQYLESDPQAEQKYAEYLANRLLQKYDSPEKAAYSWQMGHNIPNKTITDDLLEQSPRIQKYRILQGK